jgi:hypothetical protein
MIETIDALVKALGNSSSRLVIDKASIGSAVAGQMFSLWRATGVPGQGAIPAAAAICTSALTGAIGFANQTAPATSYLAWLWALSGNSATNVEVHDRLAHVGGLSGIVTTAQGALSLAGLPAARLGDAKYSDMQWWLEVYTDLGATTANVTVNVTFDNDTTGNLAVFATGATARAGRCFPLVSNVAGRFIKSINSATLSVSTGTAGNFGFTATRPRTVVSLPLANKLEQFDWALLGQPEIPNDSCLALLMTCSTTSTGVLRGGGKIAHG